MDVTTLLGTLLAALLDGGARALVSTIGSSPWRLVGASLADGRGVLVVVAVVAWLAAVLLVLVAASDGGPAGATVHGRPHPVAPLPPRRVRATGGAAPAGPAPVDPAYAAPVAVVRPRPAAAHAPAPVPQLAEPALVAPVRAPRPVLPVPALRPVLSIPSPAPAPVTAVAARAAVPAGSTVVSISAVPAVAAEEQVPTSVPTGPAAERQHGADHRHGPAPRTSVASRGRAQRPAGGSRCRRCTQPRCWPSTGERPPARVLGSGAPRACRTSLTAGTAHRCASADPWCGHERCAATPARLTLRGAR